MNRLDHYHQSKTRVPPCPSCHFGSNRLFKANSDSNLQKKQLQSPSSTDTNHHHSSLLQVLLQFFTVSLTVLHERNKLSFTLRYATFELHAHVLSHQKCCTTSYEYVEGTMKVKEADIEAFTYRTRVSFDISLVSVH